MRISIIFGLSFILWSMSFSVSAENLDSLLLRTSQRMEDTCLIDTYYRIGSIYLQTEISQAVGYVQKGINLSENKGDSLRIAEGSYQLGIVYGKLGLYKDALQNLLIARDIYEASANQEMVIRVLKEIGSIFWFDQDYVNAIQFYKEGAQLAMQSHIEGERPALHVNLAISYSRIGEKDSANYYMQKALRLLQFSNYPLSRQGIFYFNASTIFMRSGLFDSAYAYLQKSEQCLPTMSTYSKANHFETFAVYQAKQGNFTQARAFLDSGFFYARVDKGLTSMREFYKAKWEIDTLQGRYRDALYSQMHVMHFMDTLYSMNQKARVENFKSLYEMQLQENEIERLKNQNDLILVKEDKTRNLVVFLILVILLFAIITLVLNYAYRVKHRSMRHMAAVNEKYREQQEELMDLNEALSEQKVGLEITLKELEEAQNQLIQSEKMASLGVLSAGVSHEINNPLNFINGGLMLLHKLAYESSLSEEDQKVLRQAESMVQEGLDKASQVVRVLTHFADSKAEPNAQSDMNDLLQQAVRHLGFKLDSDIELVWNLISNATIECDIAKMEHVLIQLISNAIDAVSEKKSGAKQILLKTYNTLIDDENFLAITISNTGKSIDLSHMDKIFDPFFTTKDPGKGYGLGLSIAYNLIKEHKGKIMVNNIDAGVEFTVLLPQPN